MVKKFIRLGLPSKGRMKQQVEEFFLHKSLELVDVGSSREYLAKFKQEQKIQIILIAPSDIPLEIKKANLDIGITGRDLVFEKIIGWQKWMLEFKRLNFGRGRFGIRYPSILDRCKSS